jgi:hypothetical protein
VTRVTVIVEGQTEESFVKDVLAPELWPREVYLTPILLGVPGHKGGRPNYARLKKDISPAYEARPNSVLLHHARLLWIG